MGKYTRNCPICNCILEYANMESLRSAIRRNSACRYCPQKGKFVSEETKQKMRDNHYDASGANNPNYGKVSVLRNKKWEEYRTKESIARGKKLLEKGLFSGGKHTDEQKEIFRQQTRDRNLTDNPAKKPEAKAKIRDAALALMASGKLGRKTGIEKKVEDILISNDIKYVYQYPFAFWVFDLYLPEYDIFIECDGDYFHANPLFYKGDNINKTQQINVKNQKAKTSYMKNNDKKLLRFWECDINNNIADVEFKILSALGQATDKKFIDV